MSIETVLVTPGMLPPTIRTTPNSPMVWAKLSGTPVTSPEIDNGRTIRKKVLNLETPSVCEAAIRRGSTAANEAANGCTADGRLYGIEPITSTTKVNARVCAVLAYHLRPIGQR